MGTTTTLLSRLSPLAFSRCGYLGIEGPKQSVMGLLAKPSVYMFYRYSTQKVDIKPEIDSKAPVETPITDQKYAGTTRVSADTPKKIKMAPFAKNFFLGKFNTDVLVFPEVLDPEELSTLKEMIEPIEKFYLNKVDSKKIDAEGVIPQEVKEGLQELGLYGIMVPEELGGLGLNATQYCRLVEVISLDGAIGVFLSAHQAIGYKGILLYGTEEQKQKYIPKLASGQTIAAFCLTEASSGSDAASIKTRATLSEDGKQWLLNGSKIWISNGGLADFFTVFAKNEVIANHSGEKKDVVTAFLVERSFGGVTNGKPEDKLGIRGSNTCEVNFENTPVPVENVLGEIGGGFKVAVNILNSGRFSMGAASAGGLKKLLSLTTEHAINRQQFGRPLVDFHLIQEKFAKIALCIYAMESMAYLTAGMLDTVENPDCAVEAAIVKVYSAENAFICVNECLQILGGMGYMKDYPYERCLRDVRILSIFEGTNEILRLFISLTGIQHAGAELHHVVQKLRNPLMNPHYVLAQAIRRIRIGIDKPKFKLGLAGYLHPSLCKPANDLEHCVYRMQNAVELVLTNRGLKVIEYQLDLKRLADITINLYAMTAVLARASRSYCIGLRNCDHELLLAGTFCDIARDQIINIIDEIKGGEFNNNDVNYRNIATRMFDNKGYCAEHPLTRNF